jgi:PiT family inorganic phosphate transporter
MTKFTLRYQQPGNIVGAIIGWNLFTGNPTDSRALTQILSTWVTGPLLGAFFAILLYIILKTVKKNSSIHLVRFESYIRTGLIIVGAFGAYSLGANNIANVMGVFIPAFNLQELNLGLFTLSSAQQLFLLGGLAIAAGILTYSKKVMETVGNNILELSSEAALVAVLAQALVLFIFSSSWLSTAFVKMGLPPIPMVPVSSSQVIIGCIIGIGLYKGARILTSDSCRNWQDGLLHQFFRYSCFSPFSLLKIFSALMLEVMTETSYILPLSLSRQIRKFLK